MLILFALIDLLLKLGKLYGVTSNLLGIVETFDMNFESLVRHPITGETIIAAIEDGREWGQRFLNDSSWHQNRRKMANYAIKESMRSTQSQAHRAAWVDYFDNSTQELNISPEMHINLYLQVKLASALFTIYELDTKSALMYPLIVAAAAGVEMQELADYLGTQTRKSAIKKALMTKRGKSFWEINRNFGMKLMARIQDKTFSKVAKLFPNMHVASVQDSDREQVDNCGPSVISFIHAWNAS